MLSYNSRPVGCQKAEKRITKLPKQLYAKSPKGLFQKQQALVNICHMAHFDQTENHKNVKFFIFGFACWGESPNPYFFEFYELKI